MLLRITSLPVLRFRCPHLSEKTCTGGGEQLGRRCWPRVQDVGPPGACFEKGSGLPGGPRDSLQRSQRLQRARREAHTMWEGGTGTGEKGATEDRGAQHTQWLPRETQSPSRKQQEVIKLLSASFTLQCCATCVLQTTSSPKLSESAGHAHEPRKIRSGSRTSALASGWCEDQPYGVCQGRDPAVSHGPGSGPNCQRRCTEATLTLRSLECLGV